MSTNKVTGVTSPGKVDGLPAASLAKVLGEVFAGGGPGPTPSSGVAWDQWSNGGAMVGGWVFDVNQPTLNATRRGYYSAALFNTVEANEGEGMILAMDANTGDVTATFVAMDPVTGLLTLEPSLFLVNLTYIGNPYTLSAEFLETPYVATMSVEEGGVRVIRHNGGGTIVAGPLGAISVANQLNTTNIITSAGGQLSYIGNNKFLAVVKVSLNNFGGVALMEYDDISLVVTQLDSAQFPAVLNGNPTLNGLQVVTLPDNSGALLMSAGNAGSATGSSVGFTSVALDNTQNTLGTLSNMVNYVYAATGTLQTGSTMGAVHLRDNLFVTFNGMFGSGSAQRGRRLFCVDIGDPGVDDPVILDNIDADGLGAGTVNGFGSLIKLDDERVQVWYGANTSANEYMGIWRIGPDGTFVLEQQWFNLENLLRFDSNNVGYFGFKWTPDKILMSAPSTLSTTERFLFSMHAPPAFDQVTQIFDTFTDANGTDITLHVPETDVVGGGWQTGGAVGTFTIEGNQLQGLFGGNNGPYISAPDTNYRATVTLTRGVTGAAGLSLRNESVGADATWSVVHTGSAIEIREGLVVRGTSGAAPDVTDTLQVDCVGARISASWGGLVEVEYTDASDQLGSVKVGPVAGNQSFFDDFTVQSLPYKNTQAEYPGVSMDQMSWFPSDETGNTVAPLGDRWIFALWADLEIDDTNPHYLFNSGSSLAAKTEILVLSDGRLQIIRGNNTEFTTTIETIPAGKNLLLFQLDTTKAAGSAGRIWINGVEATYSQNTTVSALTASQTQILFAGINPNVSTMPRFNDLRYAYFDYRTPLDLTIPAHMAQFINGGIVQDLGQDGSLASGSQPLFFYQGRAVDYNETEGRGYAGSTSEFGKGVLYTTQTVDKNRAVDL